MHVVESVSECHHGIGYKLQLVFEGCVVAGETLLLCTRSRIVLVEGGGRAVWIATLEMILPKFCGGKNKIFRYFLNILVYLKENSKTHQQTTDFCGYSQPLNSKNTP